MNAKDQPAAATASGQGNGAVYVGMVLASLFWAGAFIAGKYSTPYIPPFTVTFLRFLFATIVLFGVIRVQKVSLRVEKKGLPIFLFTGIVGMFGYHVLFFMSLQFTTAINSSIIAAFLPALTALLTVFFLRQRVSGLEIFGIVLSLVGVLLTLTGASLDTLLHLSFNKGDLYMVGAVVCFAVYGIFSKRHGGKFAPIVLTFYSFLVCVIFLIPFSLAEQPWTFLGEIPASAWAAVLYMSIFPSVIGYLTQQVAIQRIGPGPTSLFNNLTPLFSMVLSALFLGDQPQLVQIFTALLIIAGVLICQRAAHKRG